MTPQEFFDSTVTHLRRQGKPAVTKYGKCKYRAAGGLKCAIGFHIPNELYSRTMEGRGADNVRHSFGGIADLFDGLSDYLLNEMQYSHDQNGASWGNDPKEPNGLPTVVNITLRHVADTFELDPSSITAQL